MSYDWSSDNERRSTAKQIADLLPLRVSEKGWFWDTAVCHGAQSDGLAFRQRPDGNGIDVRCHTVVTRAARPAW